MSFATPSEGIAGPAAAAGGGCEVSMDSLRSLDARTSRDAWNTAYPWLWSAGMRLAGRLLSGGEWESQREDAVATAISQVVEGVIEGKSEIFNGIATFGDLVGMTQTIVRRRITDFHRQRARSREDAVEELPDIAQLSTEARFSAAELREQIRTLDPPKPALFVDRFFGGLTTREVAERHKLPHGTVLTHFAQGLQLLRARLLQLEI
jgi:RNA polymerase sigma factor (sigma-70 family)